MEKRMVGNLGVSKDVHQSQEKKEVMERKKCSEGYTQSQEERKRQAKEREKMIKKKKKMKHGREKGRKVRC